MKRHINKLSYIWLLLLLAIGCDEKALEINYKITFESNGGLPAPAVQTVSQGDTVRRPAGMEKAGHTFQGWYSDSTFSSEYKFSSPVKTAMKLYAKWSSVSYRVVFESNGGLPVPAAQTVSYGDTVRRPVGMEKAGHTFQGWYSDATFSSEYKFSSPVKTAMKLYAKWSSVSYRVAFESNGGLPVPAVQVVSHGDTVRRPVGMEKAGHTFQGWYSDATFSSEYKFSSPVKMAMTLYAKWSSVGYRVAFESNGGLPVPEPQVVSYGDTVRRPVGMEKAGHTFQGWYSDATFSSEYKFSSPVKTVMKLYAKWSSVSYRVVFESNGGLPAPAVQVVSYGDTVRRPVGMEKAGHTLQGWYSDATFSSEYKFSSPVKMAMKLYAKWSSVSYRVVFESNGGLPAPAVQVVSYGDTVRRPVGMKKVGHTFQGWYSDATFSSEYKFSSPVKMAMTLYAKWSSVSYRVVFESNGGLPAPAVQVVSYGDTVRRPVGMKKVGHTFQGWYSDATFSSEYKFSSPVTSVMTLYAKWSSVSYRVVFESNGGLPAPAVQTVSYGDTVRRPVGMKKVGHTFQGWYSDATFSSEYKFSSPVTSAMTLYAKWSSVGYRVVFESNGGLPAPAVQVVSYGDTVRRPVGMKKVGHTFQGWYSDATFSSEYKFSSPVTSVMTLYAKWSSVSYRVVFESNGGLPAPAVQTVSYGDTVRRPVGMKKAGHTFQGWYSDATFSSEYKFSSPVISVMKLYAKWSSVSYRVAFESNGGLPAPAVQVVSYGDTVRRPVGMKKAGYTLQGWYSDATFSSTYIFSSPVKMAMKLYAKWSPVSYRVVFESNGGLPAPAVQVVSYGDTVRRPVGMKKAGYTLQGWYSDATFSSEYKFSSPVKMAMKLYAKWSLVSYRVVFESNGGLPAPAVQVVSYGDTVRRPVGMEKVGYTLQGWYSDATFSSEYKFSSPVKMAMKLYAKWSPVSYRVVFESNGGLPAPAVQVVSYGDTVRRPVGMKKVGYTLQGWYSDATFSSTYIFSSPVKTALKLYAKWSPVSYRVVFESNGGLPVPAVQTVSYGDTVRRPVGMEKVGYTLQGWYSDATFSSTYIFSSPVKTALKLYAKWSPVGYRVVFESNGGLPAPAAQTVSYGNTVRRPVGMEKAGYTFTGWYRDTELTLEYNFSMPVTSTLRLYAGWGIITPVTLSVVEGKYFVFDVGIPWTLTQDLVLQGSFAKGDIANYANDNDYSQTFAYSEDLGVSWRRDNDMKNIRIKAGKTSVRVRVRTNADEQKEVLRERMGISFSPVGMVPARAAAFTYKTNMVIVDDDVPQDRRRRMRAPRRRHELMRFDAKNNAFTLLTVIDSVDSQREKQIVDSLYRNIIDAARAISLVLPKPSALDTFSINFQQFVGGQQTTLGSIKPNLVWSPNAIHPLRAAVGLDFNLTMNSGTAFWQLGSFWKPQSFNNDGVFGATLVHEFGHILTLNYLQASYLINADRCTRRGGTFAGGVNRCFTGPSYGKQLLTDYYDNAAVLPVSKRGLVQPAMVSDYAGVNCVEDLAESFAAYVGLSENLVVSNTAYAAYRNKIAALYKASPQAVKFKQDIIATGLKIQKIGESAKLSPSSAFVISLGDGRHVELRYGGDEGCVRGGDFH